MFAFVYGSLMAPGSLRATLPDLDLSSCVPARCEGHVRSFTVAFPNAGSETDKMYLDEAGTRPKVVLFCDMPAAAGRWVNGVCIPVDNESLAALEERELRYACQDVTAGIRAYDSSEESRRVVAFIGDEKYTRAADVARGVVDRQYLALVDSGAMFWDLRCPGFYSDYITSTIPPEPSQILELRRIDAPASERGI